MTPETTASAARRLLTWPAAVVVAWCWLCSPALAEASTLFALDLEYAADVEGEQNGAGGFLRSGVELDLALAALVFEGAAGYHSFSEMGVWQGLAGARVRAAVVLEPGVFAHVRGKARSASVPAGTSSIRNAARGGWNEQARVNMPLSEH